MTSASKNVDVDKLDDILNKNSNIYHRATELKPVEIKSNLNLIRI